MTSLNTPTPLLIPSQYKTTHHKNICEAGEYTPVHLVQSVKVKTCAWEWKRWKPAIAHNLIPGAITKRARNIKFSMHNIRVTAACKIPSHTQSTVFYWLDKVNRSLVWYPSCVRNGWPYDHFAALFYLSFKAVGFDSNVMITTCWNKTTQFMHENKTNISQTTTVHLPTFMSKVPELVFLLIGILTTIILK